MSKPINFLFVGGVVRDGSPLHMLLKAFEAVHARDVEVRPVQVEPPPQLLLPAPKKPVAKPKGANQKAILRRLTPEPTTDMKALKEATGLTGKQIHMALYLLMKKKTVKKTPTGFYYSVGVAA